MIKIDFVANGKVQVTKQIENGHGVLAKLREAAKVAKRRGRPTKLSSRTVTQSSGDQQVS
jgi:hypothetical protein